MRMVLLLFLLIVLQSTITFNFTAAGNETDSDFERTISEHTTFTFSSSSPRTSVEVSGEWDGWKRHNMTLINDVYSINLKLNEGFYCYKLILDVDEWILDPSNSYKKYCDGILNSGFVVENLSKPKIAISNVSDSLLNLTVNYSASISGYEVSDFEAYLMNDFVKQNVNYTWDDDDWTFNIDVNFSDMNFDFGKYTLYLQAFDSNGSESNQITYPFWYESEKFDWNGALIYMIVTDRFVNGNISNDPSPLSEASSGADWEGGDFAGVISMLESGYFQQLGVSALWLTPFNTGADGTYLASDNTHQVSAYHGYWPIKAREIDSRLGTEAELKQLIALAHSQGIRIMNDFVIVSFVSCGCFMLPSHFCF